MDPFVVSLGLATLGGALIGLLLAVFGGGGSVLATPLLLYVVGVRDPHVAIGTSAAAVAVNALVGLRIAPEEEFTGLDLGEHNERGYNL